MLTPPPSPLLEPLVRAGFLSSRCFTIPGTQRSSPETAKKRGDARDGVELVPDARGDLGRDDGQRPRWRRGSRSPSQLPAAPAGAVYGPADRSPGRPVWERARRATSATRRPPFAAAEVVAQTGQSGLKWGMRKTMSSPIIVCGMRRGEGPHLRVEVGGGGCASSDRAPQAPRMPVSGSCGASCMAWNFFSEESHSNTAAASRGFSLESASRTMTADTPGSPAGRNRIIWSRRPLRHARTPSYCSAGAFQRVDRDLRHAVAYVKDTGPAGEERLRQVCVLHRALSMDCLISEEAKTSGVSSPHGAASGGDAGHAANAAMACADDVGRILRCRVDSSRGNLSGPAPAASRRGAVGGSRGRLLARARAVSRGGAGILIFWPLFLLFCALRAPVQFCSTAVQLCAVVTTVETGPAFRIVAYSNSMGSGSNCSICEHSLQQYGAKKFPCSKLAQHRC